MDQCQKDGSGHHLTHVLASERLVTAASCRRVAMRQDAANTSCYTVASGEDAASFIDPRASSGGMKNEWATSMMAPVTR
jgi:hypothetical protein